MQTQRTPAPTDLPAQVAAFQAADDARARELAGSLDALTEGDLLVLADIKPGTAEAWRKRGTGPAYVLLGRRVLYPRQALVEFLREKCRRPAAAADT